MTQYMWKPTMGEQLYCRKDATQNRPSIGVYRIKKGVKQLLGHVPKEVSQLLTFFLNRNGCGLSVKVIGDRCLDKKGKQMGLVVPGEWRATSPSSENIKHLMTKIKANPKSLDIKIVGSGVFNIGSEGRTIKKNNSTW